MWRPTILLLVTLAVSSQPVSADRFDALRTVMSSTCASDLHSLCPNAGSDLSSQLRCMSTHTGDLSIMCKAALTAAVSALSQNTPAPAPVPTPGSGGPAQVSLDQLKACMPGIIETCQPQLVEMMVNPLYSDGAQLIACAKGHSSTIGGACETVVEGLTKDGFATKLLSCGQSFMRLCPAESLQLMGSDATGKTNWKAAIALMKCLHPKRGQMSETCDIIEAAFETEEDSAEARAGEAAGQGYGYGYGDEKHERHHGDGDGGLIVLLLFCMCCCMGGGAGGYFYARQQGDLGISHQRLEAMRAGQEFQQLQESDGGVVSSTPGPPAWAGQPYAIPAYEQGAYAQGPIVTAQVVQP